MIDVANTGIPSLEQDRRCVKGLPNERQTRQRLLRKLRGGHPPERSDIVGLVRWALHYRTPNEEVRSATNILQRMAAEDRVYEQRLASLGLTDEEYRQETNELLERLGGFVAQNERKIRV